METNAGDGLGWAGDERFSGAATVVATSAASAATSLAFDQNAGTSSIPAPPLGLTSTPELCRRFIGAIALILLAFWFYRRYLQSLKNAAKSRHPVSPGSGRNARGDLQRRRSHLEPWNKLDEADQDKWEGMNQTQQMRDSDATTLAPMEKLTMFKKTPSVRTAYTHKSDEAPAFDLPHPFAQYHPNLAKELASTDDLTGVPVPRPFVGRTNAANEVSWGGETLGQDSFLSLRSTRLSATTSELHRWESAEVVHFDEGQTAEVVYENKGRNPFETEQEKRKSSHNNPFFNAQDFAVERRRSTSRSRANSVTVKSPTAKGKERAISTSDPFADENTPLPKPPAFIHHATTSSASSASSNDRAIQSLIAALDVTEEEVQNRLRVASMQPSVYSAASLYTSGGEDEDVTERFPLPPDASTVSEQ
ncbi:hypothetical protein BDQ17DRAFT_1393652 [Cyathus striatus]|nr:hypothetical protein BDQ17DRAFT_1393652 [Cyathus striatus]